MLKRRIIPVELLLGQRLVKTTRFGTWRDVGDPLKASQVYSDQDADELVILDIDRAQRDPDRTAIWLSRIARACFVPLAVGGGITTWEHARRLFTAGADKVIVNSAAYRDRSLLRRIAESFGSQALVVSIDVARTTTERVYELRSDCGRTVEAIGLREHLDAVMAAGAGEILLNAIDRDGTMEGFDLGLIEAARAHCRVPLIVCGGAGDYLHLQAAFARGVDAVACGSLFNFADNNPLRVKAFLKSQGIPLKHV